jgi:hypothetical protein
MTTYYNIGGTLASPPVRQTVFFLDPEPPPTLCERCRHYFRATPDSRTAPGDAAECGEPRHGILRSHTLRRALIQHCSGFQTR